MEKMLREIRERVLKNIEEARASANLEQIRVGVLGKKGELTGLLRGMGKLPPEERPKMGQLVNDVRAALEAKLEERAAELAEKEKQARLAAETIDVTLPGPERGAGSIHPMNIALRRMVEIFVGMGYEAVEGPEVEFDHYNFELLNIPKNHPARDAQDTFYVNDNIVLRTPHLPGAGPHHDHPQAAYPRDLPRPGVSRRRGRRHPQPGVPSDGGPGDR